jgi:hypothetical protein
MRFSSKSVFENTETSFFRLLGWAPEDSFYEFFTIFKNLSFSNYFFMLILSKDLDMSHYVIAKTFIIGSSFFCCCWKFTFFQFFYLLFLKILKGSQRVFHHLEIVFFIPRQNGQILKKFRKKQRIFFLSLDLPWFFEQKKIKKKVIFFHFSRIFQEVNFFFFHLLKYARKMKKIHFFFDFFQ